MQPKTKEALPASSTVITAIEQLFRAPNTPDMFRLIDLLDDNDKKYGF